MTDRSGGLRFDIYERVQLQEAVNGLEQLEHIELIPRIKVMSQGDQAVLKGHLTLTGSYTSADDDTRSETLEHYIPVEITLPMSRVQNVEEIGVEIEHFDFDLISPRSLNVTGVLSLHGIEMVKTPETEWDDADTKVWEVPSEDEVIIDSAQRFEELNETSQPSYEPLYSSDGNDDNRAWADDETDSEEEIYDEPEAQVSSSEYDEHSSGEGVDQTDRSDQSGEPALTLDDEELDDQSSRIRELEQAVDNLEELVAQKQQEMKIALNSKTYAEQNQISKSADITADRPSVEEIEQAAQEIDQEGKRTEGVEWKNLFLTKENDVNVFQKVKMCIVQREETLDTIAERYGMQAREIMLYNRLENGSLSAGQLLYIPIKKAREA